MEFKQDDVVVFKKPVTSHDGEKVAGLGTMGKVTVVGIGLDNGDTNGIEVLCEGEGYFHCRPQDLDILGDLEEKKYTLTRENYVAVANWIGPNVRISSPWKNPKLHFETGFGEPGFKTTASIGDTIEKLPDGKFQVWVAEENVAQDLPPGTTMEEAIAGMQRFGEILRDTEPTLAKRENRPAELKKFRTDDPLMQARKTVHFLFYNDIGLPIEDVYVVWFCSAVKNWKALVSTNVLDNCYYEVTHNGENGETYVDRYVKEINVKVRPDGVADFTQVSDFGRIW